MKNEIVIKKKKIDSAKRVPAMVYVSRELVDAIKEIGGGRMGTGINSILDAYKDKILETAARAKKAS